MLNLIKNSVNDSKLTHHRMLAVANLPFGVTEEQLREVFQDVGPVKSIRCACHTNPQYKDASSVTRFVHMVQSLL